MINKILLSFSLAFSSFCFGINLEGNSAQKLYLTFHQPLEKISKDWDLSVLKSYLDPSTKINEEDFIAASKLGKLTACQKSKLTGPYTPKLKGNVLFSAECTFSNGVGRVEIQAEFSEDEANSKIQIFKVTPI